MVKRALIIGGSSGIGMATVKKLATTGFEIDLIHRDRRQQVEMLTTELKALRTDGKIIDTFNLDGTNPEVIKEFTQQLQSSNKEPYQLILHALSRGNLKPFVGSDRNINSQDLRLTIEAMGSNLHEWVMELFSKKLLGKGCRIIALTSEGNERMWPGYGAVGIAKSVLETLCKYLAVELAPYDVNVNIIQAGVTDTPSLRLIPEVSNLIETSIKRNPKKRLTTPEDVANVVYLLTLPEANWINGSLIHVDGGEHLI